MNWNDFLAEQPFDHNDADCVMTALPELGLIRVQGDDAIEFLQGQLTNDITQVTPEKAQLSAWCNPKGRMLALMLIFKRDDDLYLQLPRERIDAVIKRLRMFILRARVTLDDVSDDLHSIALGGDCLPELLESLPGNDFGATRTGNLSIIGFPGEKPRVQVIGDMDSVIAFWQEFLPRVTLVKNSWWYLQNIHNGIPSVHNSTVEAFIPQMLNLDLLDGISFSKGCYTGQEVVARMKYLGQLKRRMYLCHSDAEETPKPGDKLYSPHSKSAQGAGKLVDVQASPGGGWDALAVAEISSAEAGEMRLHDENGPALELRSPPYGLEES